jgi:hypothetical protein
MAALAQSTRRKLSLLHLAQEFRTSRRPVGSWATTAKPSTKCAAPISAGRAMESGPTHTAGPR